MNAIRMVAVCLGLVIGFGPAVSAQQDSFLIFAVITEVPSDKSRVTGQVLTGESVEEAHLLANERLQNHVMWRKLEMCHSIKAEVRREGADYRVLSFKMLSAFMLPMALQGIEGDCLLKKAMQYAPLID